MKITFFNDWRLGVLKGEDRIVDVSAVVAGIAPTAPHDVINAVIADWATFKGQIAELIAKEAGVPLSSVQLRAPLPHLPAAEEDLLADDGAGARRRRDPRGRALRGIEDAAEGTALERRRLAHVRVIQRNLVYVVGLTMAVCREEVRAPATSSGLEPLKCCVSGARFLALRSGAFRARASRARATRSCTSGRTTSASADASSRCGLRRAQRSSGAASATRRFIRDGWRYQPRTGAARGRPRTAARSPRPCCRFARPAHGHFCRFSGIQRSAARTAWRH